MTHPTSPNDPVGPQAVSPEVSPGSPPQEGLGAAYPQSAAWSDDAAQPGYGSQGSFGAPDPGFQPGFDPQAGYGAQPGYGAAPEYGQQAAYGPYPGYGPPAYQGKSKVAAGVLALLTGTFGIHNFYLGHTNKALIQLLCSLLSCGILAIPIGIWSFVEGILILTARPGEPPWGVDADGVPLTG